MVDLNIRLSRNFPLREAVFSETAMRDPQLLAVQHNPSEDVVANLTYVAGRVLQPARDEFGSPIYITSGWRCPTLNRRIGSSSRSQHIKGQAFDIKLPPAYTTSSAPHVVQIREKIRRLVREITGNPVRSSANANYYLFAYLVLNMKRFEIDQLIHEYGTDWGEPGWVHVSCNPGSTGRNMLLAYGAYLKNPKNHLIDSVEQALAAGT